MSILLLHVAYVSGLIYVYPSMGAYLTTTAPFCLIDGRILNNRRVDVFWFPMQLDVFRLLPKGLAVTAHSQAPSRGSQQNGAAIRRCRGTLRQYGCCSNTCATEAWNNLLALKWGTSYLYVVGCVMSHGDES